jgi:hypothetical protein
LRTRKTKGRRGSTSTGGSRGQTRHDVENQRRAPYEAPPSILALLRGIWSRRAEINARERDMIWSFLQRAREAPLSDRQLDAAAKIGAAHGIGFDDPRLEDPPGPLGTPPPHTDPRPFGGSRALHPQPWGPLPLRPPGRSA